MRKCSVCQIEKELDKFHKKGNGHAYMCKECRKKYIRQHYQDNKEIYLEKAKIGKKRIKEWYDEFKKTLKCQNCGEDHTACLDFHHLDASEKDINISEAVMFSKKKVEEELKKCIVLCSNCHRKLHYELRNNN